MHPSQHILYLGMIIDSNRLLVFPSDQRIIKLMKLVSQFCSKTSQPALLWQRVLGTLASLCHLVKGGRLRMRPIQFHMAIHWSQGQSQSILIPINDSVTQCLLWWVQPVRFQGSPLLLPSPQIHLYTDASLKGWGAFSQGSPRGCIPHMGLTQPYGDPGRGEEPRTGQWHV